MAGWHHLLVGNPTFPGNLGLVSEAGHYLSQYKHMTTLEDPQPPKFPKVHPCNRSKSIDVHTDEDAVKGFERRAEGEDEIRI